MRDSPQWLIEAINLTRVYGDVEPIYALNQVNLKIAPGELIAVIGPSGSGKSTLLNMVGALDKPSSGEIFFNQQNLASLKDKDAFRSHSVGFIFQLHNLIPTLTARENVEMPMIGHRNARQRHQRAEELLATVGLADRQNHLPGQLSGGQRQRVAVARALANNPPLILADEPTGALDTAAGEALMALIRELNRTQGTTFIIVTHDPTVARQTDRVIVMADGKIVREDHIRSALEEDLRMWRHSGLGQKLLNSDDAELAKILPDPQARAQLRSLLNPDE